MVMVWYSGLLSVKGPTRGHLHFYFIFIWIRICFIFMIALLKSCINILISFCNVATYHLILYPGITSTAHFRIRVVAVITVVWCCCHYRYATIIFFLKTIIRNLTMKRTTLCLFIYVECIEHIANFLINIYHFNDIHCVSWILLFIFMIFISEICCCFITNETPDVRQCINLLCQLILVGVILITIIIIGVYNWIHHFY